MQPNPRQIFYYLLRLIKLLFIQQFCNTNLDFLKTFGFEHFQMTGDKILLSVESARSMLNLYLQVSALVLTIDVLGYFGFWDWIDEKLKEKFKDV